MTVRSKEASLVKRRLAAASGFPASHLQDGVSDEEQAGELSWERWREVSGGELHELSKAGGSTPTFLVL